MPDAESLPDDAVTLGPENGDEPGSFRDPTSRIVYRNGEVYRYLSERALEDWRALVATRFFSAEMEAGRIVATEEVSEPPAPAGSAGVLHHERIPFVSYPYEWPFSMLQDAALLQLDLLGEALAEDFILKDATPFNVQWRGSNPVFIDIGSFERLGAGEPWIGYRQFCRQYLYPLMLTTYNNVSFRPWLRGQPEGITAEEMRRLLSTGDRLRSGVLLHVTLQARAERRYAASERDMRAELKEAGFRKELIEANVSRLRKLVAKLKQPADSSTWSEYGAEHEHVARHREAKSAFITAVVEGRRSGLVWDLGANDGHFSRLAARSADTVVAVDADEVVIDRLYRTLAEERVSNVLPLVGDLANPSPGLGWRGRERRPLEDRGSPDLVLLLALVHHLVIGANVPLGRVIEWLADLESRVVLEWVPPEDPMVARLMANKRAHEVHGDYNEAELRAHLGRTFDIETETPLEDGGRVLLSLRPRR
jgi:SAM-dependent methyltransferase